MNNSKKSTLLVFAVLLVCTFNTHAQSKVINGKVTTYHTIAIKDAKISLKKAKTVTRTDASGNFTISADAKDRLIVEAKGFKSRTLRLKNVNDSLKIDIVIEGKESDLDRAFSYGHINRKELTAAKVKFNSVEPYSFGYSNIIELLKGKFPNANVSSDHIIVRGYNSISEGGTNGALIVINGVTSSFQALKSINILEIKNIKVLTGPAATRYGTGSGNGVLSVQLLKK